MNKPEDSPPAAILIWPVVIFIAICILRSCEHLTSTP